MSADRRAPLRRLSDLQRRRRAHRDSIETWSGLWFLELALLIAFALVIALGTQAFVVKPYVIPSGSMEPTLDIGQRVLVNRVGHSFSKPQIGQVVVFHPPAGAVDEAASSQCGVAAPPEGEPCPRPTAGRADENFIKRVVAGPGDTIAIRDGHAILNGKRQNESFIRPCAPGGTCDFPRAIKVPPGHYFMMGDNRGESDDSRFWGPVPDKWIIGGAFATYWPPKRIGLL